MKSVVFKDEDFSILDNRDFLIQKREVSAKVKNILKEVYSEIKPMILESTVIPDEVLSQSGKVSTGENYLGLPYFVLDYPRHFDGNDIFSVRVIVLWGRYITLNYILSGKFLSKIKLNDLVEKPTNLYISTTENLWHHLVDTENYKPLEGVSIDFIRKNIDQSGSLKVTQKIELKNLPDLKDRASEFIKQLLVQLT